MPENDGNGKVLPRVTRSLQERGSKFLRTIVVAIYQNQNEVVGMKYRDGVDSILEPTQAAQTTGGAPEWFANTGRNGRGNLCENSPEQYRKRLEFAIPLHDGSDSDGFHLN